MQLQDIKLYLEMVKTELETSSSHLSTHEPFVKQYYKTITRKTYLPNNCHSCIHDALIEMYTTIHKKDFQMDNRLYKLKRGKLLSYNGANYTSLTLSDDIAKAYIEAFPENEQLFFEVSSSRPLLAEDETKTTFR